MRERRTLERWRLVYALRVFDDTTGATLGHLADISRGGLLLVSERPVPLGEIRRLRVDAPLRGTGPGCGPLRLRAKSLWSRPDGSCGCHATGFRLLDPPPEAVARLEALIRALHVPGGPAPAGIAHERTTASPTS